MPVGAGADAHISDIGIFYNGGGLAGVARASREDMDSNPIPSSSASSTSRVSPMRTRRAPSSSSDELIEVLKMQMMTDAAERKAKREQMELQWEERMEDRKEAREQREIDRQTQAADRVALNQMFATAINGYLGSQKKEEKKSAAMFRYFYGR